jgi:HEAT repeat protein
MQQQQLLLFFVCCILLAAGVLGATDNTTAARADNVSGVPESVKWLVADLKSPDPAIRTKAESALRRHEKSLIQGLVFGRSDAAVEQLRYIEGPRTTTSDRAAKLEIPEKVKKLIVNLGSSYTRSSAVYALAEFGDPRVAPALIKAADHPDEDTRGYAIRNLAKVNGPGVLDKLIEALADESLHSDAYVALAKRNETQIPKLIQTRLPPRDATKAIESIRRIRNNIKQEELRRQRRSGTP